jgi:hypothetical protein
VKFLRYAAKSDMTYILAIMDAVSIVLSKMKLKKTRERILLHCIPIHELNPLLFINSTKYPMHKIIQAIANCTCSGCINDAYE